MKAYIFYFTLLLLMLQSCKAFSQPSCDAFSFESWEKRMLKKFNSKTYEKYQTNNEGLTSFEIVETSLKYLLEPSKLNEAFCKVYNKSSFATIKWDEVIIMLYHERGETVHYLFTVAFSNKDTTVGQFFDFSDESFHDIVSTRFFSDEGIKEIDSAIEFGGNSFLVYSKLNKNLELVFSKLLVGPSRNNIRLATSIY